MLAKINAVSERANYFLAIFGAGVLIILMFMITYDVAARQFFNKPLPASVEISEIMMPYIVFFAYGYALTIGRHVRVTLVFSRMPRKAQHGAEILACLIGIFLFTVLTIWSWQHFWAGFVLREEMLAAIYVPWYVGKFAFPIGAGFFAMQFLVILILRVAYIMGKYEYAAVAAGPSGE